MMLSRFEGLPDGLLSIPATGLQSLLGGPALIEIAGEYNPPLLVSVLLHGNETSGWDALRAYLREHPTPPRSLLVFIGNVAAAEQNLRSLPGQADYNRIWRSPNRPEAALVHEFRAAVIDRELFAVVDLHNNTGQNPHYAVLTNAQPKTRALAYLFADTAVHIDEPDTVLTRLFDNQAPAAAFELGPVGQPVSTHRGFDFLQRLLALASLPDDPGSALNTYRALARVHIKPGLEFGFAGDASGDASELTLTGGLEGVNFHHLEAGTEFARTALPIDQAIEVLDPTHANVTHEFLRSAGDEIVLARSLTPAMYTTDPTVVRQDCLCYFMERIA